MVYTDKIENLFSTQFREWDLCRVNYELLSKVKTRKINFKGYTILVQFNPERIRSSAAKVDAKSIEERPCFLCGKNRPAVQKGIPFQSDLMILINPFPIFNRHLTIPTESHTLQRIKGNFITMLELAEAIPGYVVFYNGPECGASAPDHLHFQAGNKGFLPIETDFENKNLVKLISDAAGVEIWNWTGYGRGIITLKGKDKKKLNKILESLYKRFAAWQPDKVEPMLNILACFSDCWTIHIIPRKKHRPTQFFLTGEDQILLSPASVDLCGVIITPREEDFSKISKEDLIDIFNQVCYTENEVADLIKHL